MRLLEGNGVPLIRLAVRVQRALERLYRIDPLHDVRDFIAACEEGERETLVVRQADEGLFEIEVRLPQIGETASLDAMCQVIEGVSHFVYVAERARIDRPTTQLELEMQAEVDKYVVLAASMQTPDARRSETLRARLYEDVSFSHDGSSERGERYRVANASAHRFVRALERRYLSERRFVEMRDVLRRFFHGNQEEKLRLAHFAA
jgi:hypothetical protein